MINQTPGGTDDNVYATTQSAELAADILTTVNWQDVKALHVAGIGLKGLSNLYRQLAGWGQHQNLRLLLASFQLAQQGQCKGSRLARTGLCRSE